LLADFQILTKQLDNPDWASIFQFLLSIRKLVSLNSELYKFIIFPHNFLFQLFISFNILRGLSGLLSGLLLGDSRASCTGDKGVENTPDVEIEDFIEEL